LRLQELLHSTSISLSWQSKRSSNESLDSIDSPDGGYYICSQTLKKSIGQQWQLTCWAPLIAKWTILFLGLWQRTSPSFSTYICLIICSQSAEINWFQEKKPW
jgi:hypothetical protein